MRSHLVLDQVYRELDAVVDPCSIATGLPIGLVSMGLIQKVDVSAGRCTVVLRLTSPLCMQVAMIFEKVTHRLKNLQGIEEIECRIDYEASWDSSLMDPVIRTKLAALRPAKMSR
jgi:metal-sulfur cluster biosynthetic enzyme